MKKSHVEPTEDAPFLGRGWAFPPSFAEGGADVAMVAGADDIHESLQILLGTMPGERVMLESFGCELSKLLFEPMDQSIAHSIERLVKRAIEDHEPRIVLERVSVTQSDTEPGCLLIGVRYAVRGTNSRFNMVYPFYLTEAALPGAR